MRLNQYVAKLTGISRRKADSLIESGHVKVNQVIAELGVKVSETDKIEVFEGKVWKNLSQNTESSKVVLMYKPKKVITTSDDPEGRKTIYDVIPKEFKSYKSAGRLDYLSEGLIILSQNGDLILSLTHPRFKTRKSYLVGMIKPLRPAQIKQAKSGVIEIEGYKLNSVTIEPADVYRYNYLKLETSLYWYNFILNEGRNRQIRKMATFFKNGVGRLIRVEHGPFSLTPEILKKGYLETTMG